MKNEEYNIMLAAYIEQLQELRKEAVSLATGIIGETLCTDDLFFCASVDRCIRLIDGLIPMLRDRNLTCVGVLLRIQMDNCMRTYAAFIAEDRNAVIRCILDGTPIKSLKDAKGNLKMRVFYCRLQKYKGILSNFWTKSAPRLTL